MYTLKILSNAEFDRLPYRYAKDALGCADAKAGVAYVRRTGVRPLDAMVTAHELDELVAKVSPHEEDGIRYKKGSQIFKTVGPILAGVLTGGLGLGPVIGTLAGAGTGAGLGAHQGLKGSDIFTKGALPGALGGFGGASIGKGAVAGFKGAGPGFFSKVGGTLKGALGTGGAAPQAGTQTAQATGGTIPAWTIGTAPGISGAVGPTGGFAPAGFGSGVAGFNVAGRGFGAGTPASALPSSALGFGGEEGGAPGVTGLTAAEQAAPTTLAGKVANVNNLDDFMGNIKRLGFTSALEQLAPSPQQFQPFQNSQLVQDVLQRVRQGATAPIGEEQRKALTFELDQERDEVIQAMKERFKALRPGSDVMNDSQFREVMTEIESDFAEKKARALAGAQINLGTQQTEQLSQLAALDVMTLARQADISIQEAQQFKDMIADLGLAIFPRSGEGAPTGSVGGLFGGF